MCKSFLITNTEAVNPIVADLKALCIWHTTELLISYTELRVDRGNAKQVAKVIKANKGLLL